MVKRKRKIPGNDSNLRQAIKSMESDKRAQQGSNTLTKEEKKDLTNAISFKVWYSRYKDQLSARGHLAEILWADFKARGCSENETSTVFDKYLKQYGITL